MSPPDILLGGGDSLHVNRYALFLLRFLSHGFNRMSSSNATALSVMNYVLSPNATATGMEPSSTMKPWVLVVVVLFTIVGIVLLFKKYSGTYGAAPVAPLGASSPTPMTEETIPKETVVPSANTVPRGETWCFVGEDVQGRWCVKVPTEHACDSNRSFPSEEDCKLVSASPMPLGVGTQGNSLMQPLGPIPAMSNTY